MSYKEINDRDAVISAIKECEKLGRKAFLKKYGFGKAKNYFVVFSGKQYDSKAILGAAHGFQFISPLTPYDFSGGKNTVVPVFKKMGFEVIAQELSEDTSSIPEELPDDAWEGLKKSIIVNKYERSSRARLSCIEHHGATCCICGFDFSASFGSEFQGFIHVHHLAPISKINKKYKVNPIKDLVPVCPNCHSIIHYGGKTRSISEVKKLLK